MSPYWNRNSATCIFYAVNNFFGYLLIGKGLHIQLILEIKRAELFLLIQPETPAEPPLRHHSVLRIL